jgi:hypothetical protein
MTKILRFPKRKLTEQERRAKWTEEFVDKGRRLAFAWGKAQRKILRWKWRESQLKERAAARKKAAKDV